MKFLKVSIWSRWTGSCYPANPKDTGITNCAIWLVVNKIFGKALAHRPNIGYTESTLYWIREQVIDRLLSLVFHFH